MIIVTKITYKVTGEEKISIPVWYDGSCRYEFYNTETKETFTRSMDMYRAKKFFENKGILHPENMYVSIPKRCLRLADYIDYVGAWNKKDLTHDIKVKLWEAEGDIYLRYLDDDFGFFVSLTDGWHARDLHMSIVEALFKVSFVRVDDTIFISADNGIAHAYKIEDVKNFDTLYTKLKVMGVGR